MLKLKKEVQQKVTVDYIDGRYCICDSKGSIEHSSSFWEDMRELIKGYQQQGYHVYLTDIVRAMALLG